MSGRVEHIGDAVLHLGDCRDVLPSLAVVDAIVTDPPFGIGFSRYENDADKASEYPDLIKFLVSEAARLCPDGPCFVWQSSKTCASWHEWFPEGYRIFAACKSFVQLRPVEVQWAWDPVIFWNAKGGKHEDSIRDWHVATTPNFGAGRESIDHPCPRPLDQVRYIVDGLRAHKILDPFAGSGTTGVAAVLAGKQFVGIEMEPRYFDVMCRRIEAATRQADLFIKTERPKPETQMEIFKRTGALI